MQAGSQGASVVTKQTHDIVVSLDASSLMTPYSHPWELGHSSGENGMKLELSETKIRPLLA